MNERLKGTKYPRLSQNEAMRRSRTLLEEGTINGPRTKNEAGEQQKERNKMDRGEAIDGLQLKQGSRIRIKDDSERYPRIRGREMTFQNLDTEENMLWVRDIRSMRRLDPRDVTKIPELEY